MNFYEVLFLILFVWSSIFTISFIVHSFRYKAIFPAVSAIILEITATVLCVFYLL